MRRTTALVAGLVLVSGLAGCGQDSSGNPDADFCAALSALKQDVQQFDATVAAGASVDELETQATAVAAGAKNVAADAQRLDDQAAKDSMNQASLDLQAAVTAATDATAGAAQETRALQAAVDQYQSTAQQVSAQVGCASG